jgi:predicted Zn-dependent peptidase
VRAVVNNVLDDAYATNTLLHKNRFELEIEKNQTFQACLDMFHLSFGETQVAKNSPAYNLFNLLDQNMRTSRDAREIREIFQLITSLANFRGKYEDNSYPHSAPSTLTN